MRPADNVVPHTIPWEYLPSPLLSSNESMSSSASDQIGTIYRFCAQSMTYPDPVWLNKKYLDGLSRLLDALGADEEEYLQHEETDDLDALIETLQIEHTRLFITGVPHVVAPPFGSVYLEKTLRGKYSDEVLTWYHEHGYILGMDSDLPDNIVHQLEMLSFLAVDKNREAEAEFLHRFFLPWFSIFSQKVIDGARHPFYPIIIRIIDFFTKEEKAYGV